MYIYRNVTIAINKDRAQSVLLNITMKIRIVIT